MMYCTTACYDNPITDSGTVIDTQKTKAEMEYSCSFADYNQDGFININDIINIIQNEMGLSPQQQSAIMNEIKRLSRNKTQQTPIRQPRPAETKNEKQQLIDKILRKQR